MVRAVVVLVVMVVVALLLPFLWVQGASTALPGE